MTIFDYNADIEKNAYMNWRIWESTLLSDNFLMMSEGYFKSSQILVEELLKNNVDKKADCVIFPVIFNFIHGIELSLKAIINSLNMLINKTSESRIEGGHNIQQILNTAIKWLRDNKRAGEAKQFEKVKCFVDDIYSKTELMDFARYPITTYKQDHFFVAEEQNVVVDLERLHESILECSGILLRMGEYYEYEIDQKNEAKSSRDYY